MRQEHMKLMKSGFLVVIPLQIGWLRYIDILLFLAVFILLSHSIKHHQPPHAINSLHTCHPLTRSHVYEQFTFATVSEASIRHLSNQFMSQSPRKDTSRFIHVCVCMCHQLNLSGLNALMVMLNGMKQRNK